MQKVCTKDGLVHISDDERLLEAFVAQFKWKATCTVSFNFRPFGCHQWGRVGRGNSCTVISRRSQDERNFCPCVNEKRASRSPILDMKKP